MRSFLPKSFSRLSIKMPAFALTSALVSIAGIGIAAYLSASAALKVEKEQYVSSVSQYRTKVLGNVAKNMRDDIQLLASNPTIRDAYRNLSNSFTVEDASTKIITHYTKDSPMPAGKRGEYNGDNDESYYGYVHRRWHQKMVEVAKQKHFYDVFFITPKGEVTYTIEKEADFGENLKTGPLKATGLARAFENVMNKDWAGKSADSVMFEDFEAYSPSNNEPAAFLASGIRDDSGALIGVLAIQMSSEYLSELVADSLGKTGMAYAVGSEGALRTLVSGQSDLKVLKPMNIHASAEEFALGEGVSFKGNPVLRAITPVVFFGKKWMTVAEIELSEVNEPVIALGQRIMLITLGMLALIALVSVLFARSIYRPVLAMRDAVSRIAAGENLAIPGAQRDDELGELARSLSLVHEAGVSASRIKAALDNANTNVMIADAGGRVIYGNAAMMRFFEDKTQEFRTKFPNFAPESLMGTLMDVFHQSPQEIQSKVAALTAPHRARIKMGGLTLELVVCPVFGADGSRLGTLVEWHDLTAELSAMGEVAAVVDAATIGDFSSRVREDDKKGVLRQLAEGLNKISNLVESAMEEFGNSLGRISEGDLTARVSEGHQGRFGQLATNINETAAQLSQMVAMIQTTTRDITTAAREINAGASDLAKRTEEEAASLEETAATTEELAASVKQTADSSRLATDLSAKASNVAAEGGAIVADAVAAIERIEQASQKISEIIGVIDDIAFQTNLLALNAAVEAARAGDAGKGFAVVASEVRTLAQRSGQAAKDIKGLIVNSTEQVVEGVKLVRATGQSLQNIVMASTQVAETVVLISSATAEQANGIEEMSSTVAHIDEMTQQNSALAEESAASANELISQIDRLNRMIEAFHIDDQAVQASPPAQYSRAPAPPAGNEPDRLRQLAAEAFAQSRTATPARQQAPAANARPAPARAAQGAARGRDDWSEF